MTVNNQVPAISFRFMHLTMSSHVRDGIRPDCILMNKFDVEDVGNRMQYTVRTVPLLKFQGAVCRPYSFVLRGELIYMMDGFVVGIHRTTE